MTGRIVVIKGYDRGKTLDLNRSGSYCIGRGGTGKEVDFLVDPCEYLTSRQHFFIIFRPPLFYIRDNHSTNGTLLQRGDTHIPVYHDETPLYNGDRIIAGNTVFRFEILQEESDHYAQEQSCSDPGCLQPEWSLYETPLDQKLEDAPFAENELFYEIDKPSSQDPGIHLEDAASDPAIHLEDTASAEPQSAIDLPADLKPSSPQEYYSVIVPEIQLFHSTVVKCFTCGASITLEAALSELQAYGLPVFMCEQCSDAHFTGLNLKNLNSYRVFKELNDDGRGLVYLARHDESGMLASIRAILPRIQSLEEDIQFLKSKISDIQAVTHPNLVRMYDNMVYRDRIYLIFEYMPEGDLMHYLRSTGAEHLSWNDASQVICDVLTGLRHCHEMGFVHGDIRPGSILFKKDLKGKPAARLGDLGVAWIYESYGLLGVNDVLGLAAAKDYTAPELLMNNRSITPQADIYSIGVIFYFLLCGKLPFDDSSHSISEMSFVPVDSGRKPVPLQYRNPDIPTLLARIVEKAIRENPSDRYESAAEMLKAILDMRF